MKKLLILSLLVFLTGCVTYYQPEAALEDGVYYAEDDPSYTLNSGDYSGVVYYPWSSLDYFYLGYWSYPMYGFSYGYSFALGYSPWGYPYGYPGYYSPWYFSHRHDPYWRPHQGNCSRRHGCRDNHDDDRDAGANAYAGDDERQAKRYVDRKKSSGRTPAKRYVLKTPYGYYGNRDIAVRNTEATKAGKSRPETARSSPASSVRPARAPAVSAPAANSGNSARSHSLSSPPRHSSSIEGRSSRHKDRD
jgi:hypothetical protein